MVAERVQQRASQRAQFRLSGGGRARPAHAAGSGPRSRASPCRRCRCLPRSGSTLTSEGWSKRASIRASLMKLRMPAREVVRWRCDLTTTSGETLARDASDGRHVFLDGDVPLQRMVPGQVDDAEAAFADGPDDLVVEQPHALGQGMGGVAGEVGPVWHQQRVGVAGCHRAGHGARVECDHAAHGFRARRPAACPFSKSCTARCEPALPSRRSPVWQRLYCAVST